MKQQIMCHIYRTSFQHLNLTTIDTITKPLKYSCDNAATILLSKDDTYTPHKAY